MEIRRLPVHCIQPSVYNPRQTLKPGDPAYEKLKRSMEEFGFVEPLVWNERTETLVGGHQRLSVLIEQGADEVDVVVVDLPIEKEKALNIALNRVVGDWDEKKLATLLEDLTQVPDFDVEVTGFDLPDVEALIADVRDTALAEREEDFDVDSALDTENPPITKAGELLVLGRHRLLCGDSSRKADVRTVVDGKPVHVLVTDPPFNVAYMGGDRPNPEKARPRPSRKWKRIYGDNRTQADYSRWLGRVMKNVKEVLAPGAAIYVWNGHRQFGPMTQFLERLGFKISCVITWAKESFALGYPDYNQQTEFCLYGWAEENGAHQWFGPSNESTLWQVHRDPTKSYVHPTQKPLELMERAIRNSSRSGQTVLDTFLGSGTTLVAAERTGRRCVGIELDAHYCDVIVRRYISFVGDENVPSELAERYRRNEEVS